MLKILQGSVVVQNVLIALTIHPLVADFPKYICTKNYESWLAVDKVIAIIKTAEFSRATLHLLLKCH